MKVSSKSYQEHRVFSELNRYVDFYESLSTSVFSFCSMGTEAHNIDTYVYLSIKGTLESIRTVLATGRINDAYALLRKYYDSAIINAYCNQYLNDNLNIKDLIVEAVNNWYLGKNKLPEHKKMIAYLKKSKELKPIFILFSEKQYIQIRDRCNDHTHYNSFSTFQLNDNAFDLEDRLQWLDSFSRDARDIFILHLAFVFFLNDHYLRSSDYLDSLECNMEPEQDSQYWVAPFIQKIFDEVVAKERPDIVAAIKKNTNMWIE